MERGRRGVLGPAHGGSVPSSTSRAELIVEGSLDCKAFGELLQALSLRVTERATAKLAPL